MNGFNSLKRIVVDTNVIFMSWYNPLGKCAEIFRKAREGKIELFSSDSVKEEIIRVFERNKLTEEDTRGFLDDIPIKWISRKIYEKVLDKTKVKHKEDKPVEAVSLILNCGILSADKHFKNRLNVDDLLGKFK